MERTISPDVVLFAIAEAYDGRIPGRTLLQKVAYFVGVRLEVDLGYGPHYYGPYSREITDALEANQDVGALIENRKESRHAFAGHDAPKVYYEYTLTERGQRFQQLKSEWGGIAYTQAVDIAKKIKGLDATYMQLAFASKVHYILSHATVSLTQEDVRQKAQELGWSMGESDINKGVDLLRTLGFIQA